jgi:hypothetical protein
VAIAEPFMPSTGISTRLSTMLTATLHPHTVERQSLVARHVGHYNSRAGNDNAQKAQNDFIRYLMRDMTLADWDNKGIRISV